MVLIGDTQASREELITAAVRALDSFPIDGSVYSREGGCGPPYVEVRHRGERTRRIGVSLSHNGGLKVVAAAGRGPVGVDAEWIRDIARLDDVADLVLSDNEAATVRASARPTAAFLRCWTRKEAVLKAAEVGLAIPPRSVEVGTSGDIVWPSGRVRWSAKTFEWSGSVISVVGGASPLNVHFIEADT